MSRETNYLISWGSIITMVMDLIAMEIYKIITKENRDLFAMIIAVYEIS